MLKSSQNKSNSEIKEKFIKFITDFTKGGLQGFSSTGTGLGSRYTNTIRQALGKEPLSQEEIDNIYAKILGTKSDSISYKTGNLAGEIIPFLTLPEIRVASFPLIANMLLTNLYQSGLDSATQSVIENGISPKIVTDVIKGVANSLMNTIVLHGLFKGVDKTKLLNRLQERLRKLTKQIAENFDKPIRQGDSLLVWKKTGNHDVSSITDELEKYIEQAKKKPVKNIKIPDEDKAVIHHNIETFGFNETEILEGFAVRFSAKYGVVIKIYDSSIENLMYAIIKKWRLK